MLSQSTRGFFSAVEVFAFLALALSGCVVGESGESDALGRGAGSTQGPDAPIFVSEPGLAPGVVTVALDGSGADGNEPRLDLPDDGTSVGPDDGVSGDDPTSGDESSGGGTTPGGQRLAELPRNNPEAADLLDHWGHRRIQEITETLSLVEPAAEDNADGLRALQAAVQAESEGAVAPGLADDDEVRVLGSHRGVTYGRWTGGPADTLSIDFDLSRAGPEMQDDPRFRAMLERAGKAWSHRIIDTWSTRHQAAGEFKGWLINGTNPDVEVRVGEGGEVSTGLEIDVKEDDLPADVAGRASSGVLPPGDSWEPHFGSIEIDRTYLQEATEASLFGTLTHELGHVLGSWKGGSDTESYGAYTDEEAGTWSGPNVVAVHGGPAPFQDAADPKTWVDGERDPEASQFDFQHSGVCVSLMSYCRQNAALPGFLPHAIDFAFLADLGVTVAEETDRPETYGLAGWTDHAGFTVSVARDLQVGFADPQPYYDGAANDWQTLEVLDLLHVGVDVFGHRSAGELLQSFSEEGAEATVRYAGGLIGAAIDRAWLPPVTGAASLAVNLGTLDGRASFTSLTVHTEGTPGVFAGGSLHYPFELSVNALVGTTAGSTLRADFYGPRHQDVAGTLHDPRAGLLAGFGATVDDRPSREEEVASADHVGGYSFQRGAADPADDGWYTYRCEVDSDCEFRHGATTGWTDWTATTREGVLAATAGWELRSGEIPDADHGFVRIARQSLAVTDGGRGRHVMDGYTGTLENVAFGAGFEKYTDEWTDPDGTPAGFYRSWAGFQGALSGSVPSSVARWSGPMVGYSGHAANEAPFVEGLATVAFSLSDNQVDLAFSEVVSRDGSRQLADFGFDDLRLGTDGTFGGGGTTGLVDGALFGASHEEAAGAFHHNAAGVTGSFGARRMPDTVTLHGSGTVRALGHFHAFDDWGFWGRQFGDALFGAFVAQTVEDLADGRLSYHTPYGRVEGTTSGDNPVSGSAVWSGKVRAVDTSYSHWMPVSGDARLEVDFGRTTIDIDFTNFEAGHGDMSWQALRIQNGAFRHTQGSATLSGSFYGTQHQGAAGTFGRDDLRGVFGTVRQTDAQP